MGVAGARSQDCHRRDRVGGPGRRSRHRLRHRTLAPPAGRITRRALVTRTELSRLTGLSTSALATPYSQRHDSGQPELAHRDGRSVYFNEADVLAWHYARRSSEEHPIPGRLNPRLDKNEVPDQQYPVAHLSAIPAGAVWPRGIGSIG